MRKATDKEINDFIKYRANHVALVQRIGRVVFGKDFSTHDSDKIEADGEKLNQYALRNAMIEGTYHPHGEDKTDLDRLAGYHVKSQKHHPEYWDDMIDPETFDDRNPPQVNASKMPDRYLLEMCCDWAAVALKRNQPLFKWINKNCFGDTRFIFTPRQQNLIVEYTNEIINSIKEEHLEYPGVKYTAKQVEPEISHMTEDDCGTGMSAGFQAQAPENPVKIGDGTGIIDPSGKLPLKESDDELLAPNGEKSNLNKNQWLQVRTPAFKKWFGDWENDPKNSSKVVDENGEPLVVYHGVSIWDDDDSSDKIERFDYFDRNISKNGFYFSNSKPFRDEWVSSQKYSNLEDGKYDCFLNIRNPLIMNYEGMSFCAFEARKLKPELGQKFLDFIADYHNYDENDKYWDIQIDDVIYFLTKSNNNKYDGIIGKNVIEDYVVNSGIINDYVAFNSNQVKSATDNNGEFSTMSNNIRESYGAIKESILDVPMKETYEGVLKDGKMVPECRNQILQTIKAWKKQINFDFNIYKVWAKGSLLTKRYNDTTDLDVGIYTDMTSDQLDEVIAILPKGQNIIVDGEESTHPLDFYIQVKGDSTDMSNFDAVYDVFNDEWVKEPEDYENEIPLDYVMEVSNFFINGCSIAIRNYENDKILYEYYNALDPNIQEITEDEKAQHLSKKKEDLKADLDALRVALRMISSFRTEAYTDGGMNLQINITSDNPHVTIQEQLAKILEKFGIRQKLRDYVAECSKLLGVERSLTESLKDDELDGTMVAVAFGRYNPPTYGHLLLWKKVASIPADANLIYASHSQDRKKNPLSYETKGALIKGILKEQGVDAEFVDSDAKTLIDVAVELSGKYDNFVFVAGSDRIEEMVDLLKKYNGVDTPKGKYEYKTIAGFNAGQRDPDADDVTGVSGTKAREIALSGDLEKFSKIIPISDEWILRDIMEEIQRNLKK